MFERLEARLAILAKQIKEARERGWYVQEKDGKLRVQALGLSTLKSEKEADKEQTPQGWVWASGFPPKPGLYDVKDPCPDYDNRVTQRWYDGTQWLSGGSAEAEVPKVKVPWLWKCWANNPGPVAAATPRDEDEDEDKPKKTKTKRTIKPMKVAKKAIKPPFDDTAGRFINNQIVIWAMENVDEDLWLESFKGDKRWTKFEPIKHDSTKAARPSAALVKFRDDTIALWVPEDWNLAHLLHGCGWYFHSNPHEWYLGFPPKWQESTRDIVAFIEIGIEAPAP